MKRLLAGFTMCLMLLSMITAYSPIVSAATKSDVNIIEINDRQGFEAIAGNSSGNYILMADIDMKDSDWLPISFTGSLDGNGHTIYNLNVTKTGEETKFTVDGNDKKYDTYFAGLFSVTTNAVIKNLSILNADVDIETEENCFASALVGYSENSTIENCTILSSRVKLTTPSIMCGVAGVIGFGYGSVLNTDADTTLIFVDNDLDVKCEQFTGGIIACGYGKIDSCTVKLAGYSSVQGYVHDGGYIGMYYVYTKDTQYENYLTNSTFDGVIDFYENNTNRRAYCEPFIGEMLSWNLTQSDNTTIHYERNENFVYDTVLLPEACENPDYIKTITEPDCYNFGYTTYTCPECGYSFKDDFTAPEHKKVEKEIAREPSEDEKGLIVYRCEICNEIIKEEEFSSWGIRREVIFLNIFESDFVEVTTLPADEINQGIMWTTSNDKVVTVDENGNIRAVGIGEATVTCTSEDGKNTLSCKITVKIGLLQVLVIIIILILIIYLIAKIVRLRFKKN